MSFKGVIAINLPSGSCGFVLSMFSVSQQPVTWLWYPCHMTVLPLSHDCVTLVTWLWYPCHMTVILFISHWYSITLYLSHSHTRVDVVPRQIWTVWTRCTFLLWIVPGAHNGKECPTSITTWNGEGLTTAAPYLGHSVQYSRRFLSGPNFVLFILSLSERKLNTRNVRYDGCVFLFKMDRTKIKHTNQLEIAQNKIWTRRKFPAIR